MSTPMTCGGGGGSQRQDVLFHVLYGAKREYISSLIEESVINIAREYGSSGKGNGMMEALQLMRPNERDSQHGLQIKFFLLLNEDEAMRRNLSNVKLKGEGSLRSVCSVCPHKAEIFYDNLCEQLIPQWIKDCRVTHEDFVDSLRAAYLCS
jgi:hypothetical protein